MNEAQYVLSIDRSQSMSLSLGPCAQCDKFNFLNEFIIIVNIPHPPPPNVTITRHNNNSKKKKKNKLKL